MDNTIFMCTVYVTKSYIGGNEPNYANGFEVYGPGQCCGTHSGSLHYNPQSCKKQLNFLIRIQHVSMEGEHVRCAPEYTKSVHPKEIPGKDKTKFNTECKIQ